MVLYSPHIAKTPSPEVPPPVDELENTADDVVDRGPPPLTTINYAAARQTSGRSDLVTLKTIFHEELDFNNSGGLSPGELRFFASDLALSDAELARIFDKFDVDGAGMILLDELLFLVGAQFLVRMRDYFVAAVADVEVRVFSAHRRGGGGGGGKSF